MNSYLYEKKKRLKQVVYNAQKAMDDHNQNCYGNPRAAKNTWFEGALISAWEAASLQEDIETFYALSKEKAS